jgi:hypothetical protein
MKRIAALSILVLLVVAAWATYEDIARLPESSLARLMPQDAVLFLEAQDFSGVLRDWNSSPEKQVWLTTADHEVFSRSRLFLRLKQAQDEFASAIGLSPDMSFLSDVAGQQSALGIYDIGKLELLYVTRLPSANAMKSGIWQQRAQFEARQVDGKQFYVRTDPQSQRVVAFAIDDDYLVLGTREDLVAGALSLLADKKAAALNQQGWFVNAIKSAKDPGELRMVIHLAEVTRTPQFRTYWVQQNITELRQYESSVSDLFRSSGVYREERSLLLKNAPESATDAADGGPEVAELMRLIPPDAGFYRAFAVSPQDDTLALLEQKILAPGLGPAPASKVAPNVNLGDQSVGNASNLDVRIDTPPSSGAAENTGDDALKELLKKANIRAALQLHRSQTSDDGVFVRLHSTIVLLGATDWPETTVQQAIQRTLSPGLTASNIGVAWKKSETGAQSYSELDGLARIAVAVRGKYLFVSDDPEMLVTVLGRVSQPVTAEAAIYYARFDHSHERQNFYQLFSLIDRPSQNNEGNNQDRTPQFFSQNIASLSKALAGVKSQSMVARRKGGIETQTVRYECQP